MFWRWLWCHRTEKSPDSFTDWFYYHSKSSENSKCTKGPTFKERISIYYSCTYVSINTLGFLCFIFTWCLNIIKALFSQGKLFVSSVCYSLIPYKLDPKAAQNTMRKTWKRVWKYSGLPYFANISIFPLFYPAMMSCLQAGNSPKSNWYLSNLTCVRDFCCQHIRTY